MSGFQGYDACSRASDAAVHFDGNPPALHTSTRSSKIANDTAPSAMLSSRWISALTRISRGAVHRVLVDERRQILAHLDRRRSVEPLAAGATEKGHHVSSLPSPP